MTRYELCACNGLKLLIVVGRVLICKWRTVLKCFEHMQCIEEMWRAGSDGSYVGTRFCMSTS